MKLHHSSERGQALVIIALAMIGLIAMTGLAIDGGNVYSDRRHAQNAADAAALAAGLARVREDPGGTTLSATVIKAGTDRAGSNGYIDDGFNSVQVISPPESGAYKDDEAYIQVIIISHVQTYFARVLGIEYLTNNVNAVVRVEPFPDYPVLDGNAIVSCNQTECPAVTVGGGSSTTLIDGGLFVNSNCEDDSGKLSFVVNTTGNEKKDAALTAPSLCTVGGYENMSLEVKSISSNCQPIDCATQIKEPNFDNQCKQSVSQDPNNPNRLLPGEWTGNQSFPPDKIGKDTINKLAPGVYCINSKQGFSMTSGSLYGGCDPDKEKDGLCFGEAGVVFYMQQGGININTNDVQLYAPRGGFYDGLLFFVPESNGSDVTINGNAGNRFVGTIMAMGSHVKINGGSDTDGLLSSQIIANTVDISGNADTLLQFDSDKSYQPEISPQIEFIE